jgi:hypothetical protein
VKPRQSFDLIPLPTLLGKAKKVGPTRGVYFLFHNEELVYIGRTPNVYRRVGEHINSKKIDSFYLLPIEGDDLQLASIERAYLHKYMPSLNAHKRFWEPLEDDGSGDKTTRAIAFVDAGETPYAAAKKVGIALSTIYRALARKKRK